MAALNLASNLTVSHLLGSTAHLAAVRKALADWVQEVLKLNLKLLQAKVEIEVEETKELGFHEVDLSPGESKLREVLEAG